MSRAIGARALALPAARPTGLPPIWQPPAGTARALAGYEAVGGIVIRSYLVQ